MNLYPYQKEASDFHLRARYSLNCSEMGTGKTRMALSAAKESGERLAVFGPVSLYRTWREESDSFGVDMDYFPYSQLVKVPQSKLDKFGFWIADEVHYLKSPKARRTDYFYQMLRDIRPRYFVGLTGTPIRNRVPDFWTLLAFCSKSPMSTNGKHLTGNLATYHGFSSHFCHVEESLIRGVRIRRYHGIKEGKEEELKDLLRGKYIRFTVDKVLKFLPPITDKFLNLGLAPSRDLEEVFNHYISGSKIDPTAKAASALLKAPKTADYCNSIIEETGEPLVIFTDHVESAKLLNSKISNSALCVGATPAEDRMRYQAEFQNGRYDAIIGTIGAMSVGVTLTRARHVIFNDLSWTPSDNAQAKKRIHRIGQDDACFAHYIISSDTDEYIVKTLSEKEETINKIL